MKIINLRDYLENLSALLQQDKMLAFLYAKTRKIRNEIVCVDLKEIGDRTIDEVLSVIDGDFIRI